MKHALKRQLDHQLDAHGTPNQAPMTCRIGRVQSSRDAIPIGRCPSRGRGVFWRTMERFILRWSRLS